MQKKSVEAVKKLPRHPIILILENIRSAHNVGALFRTADGALLEKIILVGQTPLPPSMHIDKTALGATEVVPWQHADDTVTVITELRKKGYAIAALEQTETSMTYYTHPLTFPLALVVGNEITGVAHTTLDACDYSLDIPMHGRASSLNVATATGIVIYDILRQFTARV